jgi:hypothetical protein
MKYLITERQYGVLLEQQVRIPMPLQNPVFDNVIKLNKKFFGLPVNSQITPDYSKKINDLLNKKNVNTSQRTLMGALVNFIPVYETAVDLQTLVDGIITGDKSKFKGGLVALSNPVFSYKAINNLIGWFSEKLVGKEQTDYNEKAFSDLVNMKQQDREKLFKRYGYGGYEKWVKAGKPKL